MVHPAIITGLASSFLTAWLSDSLPKPGLPWSENEKRLRNMVLGLLVGYGVAHIAMLMAGGEVKAKEFIEPEIAGRKEGRLVLKEKGYIVA